MESNEAAPLFAALAQESRLDLLRLLIARGPTGLPAGEIAARLGLPASTASFHLAALERAGLIQATRQGRQIVYAARVFALRGLFAFLAESCCGGEPERCGDLARLFPPEEPPAMTPAFNVLFLCTRNSARSIMAEAILAKQGAGRFRAFSAGSEPAAAPMPELLEKLAALGHDIAGLHSKSWDRFAGPDAPRMDFVIALCDVLDGQACPDFGAAALTAAWPLPDPAKFSGTAAE
ncbi:MAG: metalloregulator ArsR/SmtB family transcription factor, partial [Rhodospirillales bacterium]|nr:metalloregulator ArsR/SmtB family transcription factor [Rhodospirillales bacterium]